MIKTVYPTRFENRRHKQYDLAYQRRLCASSKMEQREQELSRRERQFEEEKARWEAEKAR